MTLSPENRALVDRESGSMVVSASAVTLAWETLDNLLNAARSEAKPKEVARLQLGVAEIMAGLVRGEIGGEDVVWATQVETLWERCAGILSPDGSVEFDPDQSDAQAILSKLQGGEGGTSGGRVPASPDGLTEAQRPTGDLRHYADRAGMAGEIHIIDRQFNFVRAILPYDYAYTSNSQQWDEARRICEALEGPMSALGIVRIAPAPSENSAGQPSEASTAALATDEPLSPKATP